MSLSEYRPSCCPTCLQLFDSKTHLPIVYFCGHSICKGCDENPMNEMHNCAICRAMIIGWDKNLNTGLIETLKDFEKALNDIGELDYLGTNYECSNCQNRTLEKNMHVCKTCVVDQKLLDLTTIAENERSKKVIEVSMCSDCVIPLHAYKGHTIVPLFSMLREYNIASGIQKKKQKLVEFEQSCSLLVETFESFKALSIDVPKYYNLLSNIAQNDKLIDQQNEVFQKIEEFMNKCLSIVDEVKDQLTDPTFCPEDSEPKRYYPKLEKFRNKCDLLDHLFARVKGLLAKGEKKYNWWTEMEKVSESTEEQNRCFESQMFYLSEGGANTKEIANRLKRPQDKLQDTFTNIEEWCTVQMGSFADEIKI